MEGYRASKVRLFCLVDNLSLAHWSREHLYRRHHYLLQCQRCKDPFYSQIDLDKHAETIIPCQPRARQLRDGFTGESHALLHRKKKAFPGQNDEEKWKEIFQLLFPNRPVPSPCKFVLWCLLSILRLTSTRRRRRN